MDGFVSSPATTAASRVRPADCWARPLWVGERAGMNGPPAMCEDFSSARVGWCGGTSASSAPLMEV